MNDSYASRKGKGLHAALRRVRHFAWKLSRNDTKTVWVLQCDVAQFFASVDHRKLLSSLARVVEDRETLRLLHEVIRSFQSSPGKGIPLGNLTSQLFSNVYLDSFDQYVKRELRQKFYVRYADDVVILHESRRALIMVIPRLHTFLSRNLLLQLHPEKVRVQTWYRGVDFLGYVLFPHHVVLRPRTKRRMLRKVEERCGKYRSGNLCWDSFQQSMQSSYGVLHHCRGFGIRNKIEQIVVHSLQ